MNEIVKNEYTEIQKYFDDYGILLAEHKDRVTRFGYHYIENLLTRLNVKLEVINNIENKRVFSEAERKLEQKNE